MEVSSDATISCIRICFIVVFACMTFTFKTSLNNQFRVMVGHLVYQRISLRIMHMASSINSLDRHMLFNGGRGTWTHKVPRDHHLRASSIIVTHLAVKA